MRYNEYLALMAAHESRGTGDYQSHHGSYLGRYQMGPLALQDAGFMNAQGNWTGRYGVWSNNDFLNNPDAQDAAFNAFNAKNWGYIQHYGLDQYIGDTIDGVEITPYGLLAGYQLKGIGVEGATDNADQGLRQFLESGGAIDPVDGLHTPISHYIQDMGGYPDPADNFSGSPFIAFPDPFGNLNDQFSQALMPAGWDQLPDITF